MAMFRMQISPVGRSSGRKATAGAAYRAGERIRDERTGAVYDHRKRDDVLHKEIFLPTRLEGPDSGMEWARDRSTLWNAAEKAERQSNSRVAREYQIALPPELSAEQRVALARAFSREIADRYDVAVDLAVHAPRPEGDPRNFHAHLLATTRAVTPAGLGPKTGLDMDGGVRSELGLPPSRQEFRTLRARWAELTNEALKQANLDARVDHRSLEAQGIDREPRPHLPWGAVAAERRGERSEVAERIRERHHARLQARRVRTSGEEAAANPGQAAAKTLGTASESPTRSVRTSADLRRPSAPDPPRDMEARRRQAVQDWLAYRAGLKGAEHAGGEPRSPPLSMEEIRQRAVAAWRSLRARGAESQPAPESRRDRDAARDQEQPGQARDTPGLADDLSG
ncbi:MAG TPA: MobQ family relaxase [Steroidobacteraceae bacterium]|nr:MobQ family relaxase [Steroidobacteraceae bacterium]